MLSRSAQVLSLTSSMMHGLHGNLAVRATASARLELVVSRPSALDSWFPTVRRCSRTMSACAAGSAVVIAVDGPAAAGKGTLSKQLAAQYQLAHLDTGLLYRAVGYQALQQGVGLDDEVSLEHVSQQIKPEDLKDVSLRSDAAATAASKVSSLPRVRAALLQYQRDFASDPPYGAPGAVLDGRDVGTRICPNAPIKLFVTASPEVRAKRRMREFGPETTYEQVLQDLVERDERDRNRKEAPLIPAEDAVTIDTSNMSADQALEAAVAIVSKRLPQLTLCKA